MTNKRKISWLMFIAGFAIYLIAKPKNILDPVALISLALITIGAVSLRLRVYPPFYPRDLEKRIDTLEQRQKDASDRLK